MTAALVADLRRALAPDRVRDGATELALYRHDASAMEGAAVAVCFPLTTAEVQSCVRIAADHGVPFVARGAGTGLAGGAVPPDGAVVVSVTKMNRILSVDPVMRFIFVTVTTTAPSGGTAPPASPVPAPRATNGTP